MTSKLRYIAGEEVVYPNHGICIIQNIKEETIGGISGTFYNVKVIETGSSLFIPSGNLATVGIRSPLQKSEVQNIYDLIENDETRVYSKWKNRYEENLKFLSTGTPENMVRVLKSLFYVAAKKTLSFREKKMQEKALSLLASEIAHSEKQDTQIVTIKLDDKFKKSADDFIKVQG